jgi:tRNA G46 methylase TrmB
MPTHNMLGLEIRDPVIERANAWAERLQLHKQVLFLSANATISVETILNTPSSSPPYPGLIDLVTIQFPDPHFKKKHKKRRTVQPNLILTLANIMKPGRGRVFLQSDVLEVAEDMRNQFERHGGDAFTLCHELHNTTEEGCVFYQSSSSPSRGEEEEEEIGNDNKNNKSNNNKDDDAEWQSQWADGGWLVRNPIEVPTEREVLNISRHRPVYRVMLVKT